MLKVITLKKNEFKEMTNPSSMHETGHSKPRHRDNPEGWDGEGDSGWGAYVHLCLIHVNV